MELTYYKAQCNLTTFCCWCQFTALAVFHLGMYRNNGNTEKEMYPLASVLCNTTDVLHVYTKLFCWVKKERRRSQVLLHWWQEAKIPALAMYRHVSVALWRLNKKMYPYSSQCINNPKLQRPWYI